MMLIFSIVSVCVDMQVLKNLSQPALSSVLRRRDGADAGYKQRDLLVTADRGFEEPGISSFMQHIE